MRPATDAPLALVTGASTGDHRATPVQAGPGTRLPDPLQLRCSHA